MYHNNWKLSQVSILNSLSSKNHQVQIIEDWLGNAKKKIQLARLHPIKIINLNPRRYSL